MEPNRQTKKVSFCCPYHGALKEDTEYFSVNMQSKVLVDVPVKYCKICKRYYTPFANLARLFQLDYKGTRVMGGAGRAARAFPREEVRVPYFSYPEDDKSRKITKDDKAEQFRQYLEGLREVPHNSVILSNKPLFINEHKCPVCHERVKREQVKISQRKKFLLSDVCHCERCGVDLISPKQFKKICDKAERQIRGWYNHPFISPVEMDVDSYEKGLFIPRWALDLDKYDDHHLPPRGDAYYEMTDKEYSWVVGYHQLDMFDVMFDVKLRKKSFLGEAGYSTSESEIRRHKILKICVEQYGKSKVINQLNKNISLRLSQKDGNVKYQNALNIWRGDISYVEKEL